MVMRSKRAQFFILSAVIIAAIIVSMASVKNYVITGNVPRDFYRYSEQLEYETGAVVDYVFFNSGSSQNISNFFGNASDILLSQNSGGGIFVCFYFDGSINCKNNGIQNLQVWDGSSFVDGGNPIISDGKIKFKAGEVEYSVPVLNKDVAKNQFYFVFRINSTSGEYVYVS